MRTLVTAVAITLTAISCNGQSGAIDDQKKVYKALDEMIARGMVATTEGGYTLTCLIDGKPWKAQAMYPVSLNSSIHGVYGESSIDLPYGDQFKVGDKPDFKYGHGPIFAPPEFDLYSVHTGHMEITKKTSDWLEGTFVFTATLQSDPKKKMEITNGFFRVSMKKK